jgi:hypothetical protein
MIVVGLSARKCTDPTCPCQDGDACHYEDAPAGWARARTKAHPLPPGVRILTYQERADLYDRERGQS